MKRLSFLKIDFPFRKKILLLIILFCVPFACRKNNYSLNNNPDSFFKYSGSNALVIKTISQLKNLNNKEPFVDSLNNIGTIKWDAYLKSTTIDSCVNNYHLMVPYLDKQNVLTGYIDINVNKNIIDDKPITYNYKKDCLNNTDIVQRYIRGNVFKLFAQKNITLPEGIIAMHISDKKQLAIAYSTNVSQQLTGKSNYNQGKILDAGSNCENIYNLSYLYEGADNDTNIQDGINNNYVLALEQFFAGDGASFSVTSQGLIVQGPTTVLQNQITMGALVHVLETVPGVEGVLSSQLVYGTCSAGGGGGSPPVTPDPCTQAAALSAMAVNSVLAAQNSRILSQTTTYGIEYGANQNLTSLTGNTYVNTPVTSGTTSSWTPNFTWAPPSGNIGGYTVGYSHGHPGNTGPSPADAISIVNPIGSSALRAAGATAIQTYESKAFVNTVTNTGSYMVTINNWSAMQTAIQNATPTASDPTGFDQQYITDGKQYLTNNPNATPGDVGAYALMSVFGNSISIYFAPTGSTTYSPLAVTTSANGAPTITKTPCSP